MKRPLKRRDTASGKTARSSGGKLLTGSSAPKAVPRTLEAGIGAEVRRLRKELDLTVSELGIASGISGGMLSKIENGTISPSLQTLDSLAKALNVSISRLFSETEERRDCSFVKAGHGLRIERRGTKSGHLYDLLGHSLRGEIAVEPYLISLQSDALPYTEFRHAGVEFIYMLSGRGSLSARRSKLCDGSGRRAVLRCRCTPWAGGIHQVADGISFYHHLFAALISPARSRLPDGDHRRNSSADSCNQSRKAVA